MEGRHAVCVERCLHDIHRNSMFGDERFKQYGCSEPGMLSDLVCVNAIPNRILFQERNGVQQEFEKGRSHRFWFRRNARLKN